MKKALPKRKDLRKRIAELEKENRRLKFGPPDYHVAVQYRDAPRKLRGEARFHPLMAGGSVALLRRNAILDFAGSMAKSLIDYRLIEITEETDERGWHRMHFEMLIVPTNMPYSPEIEDAISIGGEK